MQDKSEKNYGKDKNKATLGRKTKRVGGSIKTKVKYKRKRKSRKHIICSKFICVCVCVWRFDPIPGHGLPYGAPRSHTMDTPHSVGLLWTSDQHDAYFSTSQNTTLLTETQTCPPAGFEPTIPASERQQIYALDCAATGIGIYNKWL